MPRPVRSTSRALALLLVAGLFVGACNGSGDDGFAQPTPSTLTPTTQPPSGRLVGMQGTVPYTELSKEFRDDLARMAPALKDTSFAAHAYDTMISIALAAELARSDAPGRFASEIVGTSSRGAKCTSWRICRDVTDKLGDADYDGASGAIQMLATGEPGEGGFAVMRFEDDDQLERIGVKAATAEEPLTRNEVPDPLLGPRPDGVLRVGMLLPSSGPDAELGEAQRAGIRLAVEEINELGGVLGEPVELIDGDSGTTDEEAVDAAATLMDDGVDAIIGPARADTALAVLPSVTGAGVVLFSPSATGRIFGFTDHNGLFFRMAPADALQGKVLADVVAADGVNDVVDLAQEGADGEGASEDFRLAFEDAGGRIAATVRFNGDSVDPAVYNAVLATPSDGIVVFGNIEPVGALITSLSTAGRGPEQGPYYMNNISAALADYVN